MQSNKKLKAFSLELGGKTGAKIKKNTISYKLQPSSLILGIDPGYGRMGIAVLDQNNNNPKLIHSECFETEENSPHEKRLLLVSNKVSEVIKKYKPNKLAIESLLFSKNQKTAIKVAEARGVILAEAARMNLDINELNPNEVKLSVTGYGKSDKGQVMFMIDKILKPYKSIVENADKKIKYDDEYDAIAVALACSNKRDFKKIK